MKSIFHNEDDTFHTNSKTKSERVGNIYYESFTLKLIKVKWKVSFKRVLFFTSFKCL